MSLKISFLDFSTKAYVVSTEMNHFDVRDGSNEHLN